MTKSESLIRSIIGPVKMDVRPLAFSVEVMEKLLFSENRAVDEVHVTKHIYPEVAKKFTKTDGAAARQVERAANYCWDNMNPDQKKKYIGRLIIDIRRPADMIAYFAFYLHFERPFFQVVEQNPELLF